jgi:hypothetical protein
MRPLATLALAAVLAAAFSGTRVGAASVGAVCHDGGARLTKLNMIERLSWSPETLILGSSRSQQAEPAVLRKLTGRTAFNAGVMGGTAADAWVMTRVADDRLPRPNRRYLWFVDAGIATNGVPPELAGDPRARKYLDPGAPGTAVDCRPNPRFAADGSIAGSAPPQSRDQAARLAAAVDKLVVSIRANPPKPIGRIDQLRYTFFERAIAFMNEHGSRPVIVLNPIHPRVLAELEKYGFPLRAASDEYLTELHRRLNFIVVNCQDTRVWGGSGASFTDPTHVGRVGMRKVLAYVVDHSGRALR